LSVAVPSIPISKVSISSVPVFQSVLQSNGSDIHAFCFAYLRSSLNHRFDFGLVWMPPALIVQSAGVDPADQDE